MNTVLEMAKQYTSLGFSVIPIRIDGSKAPALNEGEREPFEQLIANESQLVCWFSRNVGIGILGGKVSGGLEVLDFDKPGIFEEWLHALEDLDFDAHMNALALPRVTTPAHGDHLYYRCDEISGSMKLATAHESFVDCTGKSKTTMIETRGEGGYVVAPGSPACCHKAGRTYDLVNGSDLARTPKITPAHRRSMLDAARSFNEVAKDAPQSRQRPDTNIGARPGDDFNARGPSWSDILHPAGWVLVRSRGETDYWRRPGKEDGISATTGKCGDKLYVFSSNASPFESDRAYDKFAAFTILSHSGDFKKATKDLGGKGYGERRSSQSVQPAVEPEYDPTTGEIRESHLRVVPDGAIGYVKDFIPDAPVTVDQVTPEGWVICDERAAGGWSVQRLKRGRDGEIVHVPVIYTPTVVQSWVSNNTTGLKCQRIAWKALGKWRSIVVENSKLAEASQITKACADKGFRVTSSRAKDVVDYLDAYWQTNAGRIPNEEISEQMGWQRDGSFIAGRRTIGESSTTFHANDAGDDQIADFVTSSGSFEKWAESLDWLQKYPRVQLAIYAALAPPLLDFMGIQNFILDWSYRTSTGKSTALNVAASVWGRPGPGRYVGTWNTTRVAIERRAAVLSGLPLILDDTKQAPVFQGQCLVSQIIYEIASSSGKSRGSVKGTRHTERYNTVLLTSGESRIIDYSKDGGTAGRAISLWGHPFDGDDVSTEIGAMNIKIAHHFGHLGPLFIEYLLKNREKWSEWGTDLDKRAHEMVETARGMSGGDVAARISRPLALIGLVGRLCHQAVSLPWEWHNPVTSLFTELTESLKDTDRAKEAAEHVYRWAVENKHRFYGQHEITREGDAIVPLGGWLGTWQTKTPGNWWDHIDFAVTPLLSELHRAGHDAMARVREWADRKEWVRGSAECKWQSLAKINGQVCRVISLRRRAVPEADLDAMLDPPVTTVTEKT